MHSTPQKWRSWEGATPTGMLWKGLSDPMQKLLIILGLTLLILGLLWPLIAKIGLGRLPGDIMIKQAGFLLYFPLTTSLLISAALTLILWIVNR